MLCVHRCSLKYQGRLREASVACDLFDSSSYFSFEASCFFPNQKKNNRSPKSKQRKVINFDNKARQYSLSWILKIPPQILRACDTKGIARLQSHPWQSGHFTSVKRHFNFLSLLFRNDFISFWKLSGLSVFSLFYCLQMFWTVSLECLEYDLRF